MPIFSTMYNLIVGGSESPSRCLDENDSCSLSRKAKASPGSLSVLKKLNRKQGDALLMENNKFAYEKGTPSSSSKKRERSTSEERDINDENSGTTKRRRVNVSKGDDFEEAASFLSTIVDKVSNTTAFISKIETNTTASDNSGGEPINSANEVKEDHVPVDDPSLSKTERTKNGIFANADVMGLSMRETRDNYSDARSDHEPLRSSEDSFVSASSAEIATTSKDVDDNSTSATRHSENSSMREDETMAADNFSSINSTITDHSRGDILIPKVDCLSNLTDEGKSQKSPQGNQLVPNLLLEDDKQQGMWEEENCDEQVVHERQQKNESEEDKERKLVAQQISDGVLTDSMLREENKLKKENLKEEREIVDKAMAEYDSTVEEQRYARLQHLLKKSDVYSAFLLQRIEEQKQENKKKRLREAKKAEKTQKEVSSPQAVPESKRSRRDKKASSEYNFSDYLDTEALKKSSAESMCAPNKEVNKNLAVSHDSTECASSEVPKKGFVKPKLLTGGELRDYQEEGVEWLKVLFENGVNGILADEMGLGKTVQCIALLAHLVEWGVRGPFLVVAPLSTLPNWLSEFKRFTPNLFASIYHGTPDERTIMRKKFNKKYGVKPYRAMPVIITSYSIVINDSRHLMKYNWKYLIVDEGHRIKDFNCKLIRELKLLPSANRLLLTGTPLQNNLAELWSLLNFLLPDIFNDLESFQAWFDFSAISQSDGDRKIIAQEREHHVLERLHSILTPFLLRRLKTDVSLDIPLKKEVFVYAPLTQLQKVWYRRALDRIELLNYVAPKKETPQSYSATGRARRRCTSMKTDYSVFDRDDLDYEQFVNVQSEQENRKRALRQKALATPDPSFERNIKVLNLYVLLRKVCMHPYLLEYPIDPETQDYRMDEELITSSGKTLLLDQMLPELKRRGHKVLLFSQWTKQLDILQDICYIRDYKYSRIDGDMKFAERQIQIENFNSDQNVFIFLLSTRAGGLGLNLTAADTAIIYDSDWNPQMDLQAQDRCHRIGQTKPVIVYRLITANTVDEKIVEVARDKRRLEKMVIHKERFKGMRTDKALSSKEIMHLLQSCDHNAAINSKEVSSNVLLTKEQLNKLMDRSDMVTDGKSKATAENVDDDEDEALFKVVKSDE